MPVSPPGPPAPVYVVHYDLGPLKDAVHEQLVAALTVGGVLGLVGGLMALSAALVLLRRFGIAREERARERYKELRREYRALSARDYDTSGVRKEMRKVRAQLPREPKRKR